MFASAAAVAPAGIRTGGTRKVHCSASQQQSRANPGSRSARFSQRELRRVSARAFSPREMEQGEFLPILSGEISRAAYCPLSLRERAGVRVNCQGLSTLQKYTADAGSLGGVAQRQSGGLISPRL